MARNPYAGGGPGSTEKDFDDSLWASLAPTSSTGAPAQTQGGRTAASGPASDVNQQSTASATGSHIWSFPNVYPYNPMTPISQFLLQDVPTTPLPYTDSWSTPSMMSSIPIYGSNPLSSMENLRSMSFTQCLQEGMSMGSAALSSYNAELIGMARPSLTEATAFSISGTSRTYMSSPASSSWELKREQQEEAGFASASQDVARLSFSAYEDILQEMGTPSSSSPLISRPDLLISYQSPTNVSYTDVQAASFTSSSSSDEAGHRAQDRLLNEEEAQEPSPPVAGASAAEAARQEDDQEVRLLLGAAMGEDVKSLVSEQDHPSAEKAAPSETTSSKKPQSEKSKKKGQKRHREPRVALVTKSEVEHLEDGFRWRKYGQKAVKNSPYPRSYYRCTNSKCFVKKRVERSPQDPSLVITTYEGQHNHHSPAVMRGTAETHVYAAAAAATFSMQQPQDGSSLAGLGGPSSADPPPAPPFSFFPRPSSYDLPLQLRQFLHGLPPSLLSSISLSSLPPSLQLPSPLFSNPAPPAFPSPTPPPAVSRPGSIPSPSPSPGPSFSGLYPSLQLPPSSTYSPGFANLYGFAPDPFSSAYTVTNPAAAPTTQPSEYTEEEQEPPLDALQGPLFPPKN